METNGEIGNGLINNKLQSSLAEYVTANIQVMEQLRGSVTLFCEVKTTAREPMHSNITWYRNHHVLKSDDRFHVNNFKLRVRGPRDFKEKPEKGSLGGIRCGAHSSRAGMIFSKSFDLDALFERIERNSVHGSRRRTNGHQKRSNDSPRRIITYTEDQIVLNCRLSVSSTDFIQWTKDGKPFKTSRDEGSFSHDISIKDDGECASNRMLWEIIPMKFLFTCRSLRGQG